MDLWQPIDISLEERVLPTRCKQGDQITKTQPNRLPSSLFVTRSSHPSLPDPCLKIKKVNHDQQPIDLFVREAKVVNTNRRTEDQATESSLRKKTKKRVPHKGIGKKDYSKSCFPKELHYVLCGERTDP